MGTFDHLDDPLDDLLSGATPRGPAATKHTQWFEQPCDKCQGRGQVYSNRSGRLLGACFACKGSGKFMYKTSPQARARQRETYANKVSTRKADFAAEHKAEIEWIGSSSGRGHRIAADLKAKLEQYGTWTEPQVALIRRLMAQQRERTANAMAQRAQRATDIDVSAIEEAFQTARDNAAADGDDIRSLRLLLSTFKFAPAKNHSGAIYVYDLEQSDADGKRLYLGKCQDGKFHPSRECTDDQAQAIAHAASDPEAAAKEYGQRFKHCSVCGRELTNQESRERGIGPVCAERYGW